MIRTWQEFVTAKEAELTEMMSKDTEPDHWERKKVDTGIKHGQTSTVTQGQSVRPFTAPDPDAKAKVASARIHSDKKRR